MPREGTLVVVGRVGALSLVSLVIACGGGLPDLGFKDASPPEDSPSDGGPTDAQSEPSNTCNPIAPFGAPVKLTGTSLGTGFDYAPTLTANELTMFYSSTGDDASPNVHLYYASRNSLSSPFGPASLLGVNGATNDSDPALSADGLTLFFQTDRVDGVGDVFESTRATLQDDFTFAYSVPFLNTTSDDTQPVVDVDQSLWLASDRPGTIGMLDIFHAENPDGAFAQATPESELNSPDDDWSPTLSADGLTMFFASKRAGGAGGDDIYVATRSSLGAPFTPPARVTELDTADNELPHWLSLDGCRLYMERNTGATYAIYVATRGH